METLLRSFVEQLGWFDARVETPPSKRVETPPSKRVETPPNKRVETPPSKRVETPPNNTSETVKEETTRPYPAFANPPVVSPTDQNPAAFVAPATTVDVPADDPPGSPDDRSIDFDDALSKIFGEDRDTPVPPVEKPGFAGDKGGEKRHTDKIHSASDVSQRSDTDKQDTDSTHGSGPDR